MARRGRSRYEPIERGYVTCADTWRTRIFYVDCSTGGAQLVFEDLCRGFERPRVCLAEASVLQERRSSAGQQFRVSIRIFPLAPVT